MKWIKGIGLFLIANFLIYLTLSLTAQSVDQFRSAGVRHRRARRVQPAAR